MKSLHNKIVLAMLALPCGAMAQAPAPAPPAANERVEITGSRIRSLSAESASTLQVITAEDIASSGATNV